MGCVRWNRMGGWESVHGELITQVVKDVVGGCGEAAGVGESQVGGNEEVGDVFCGDVSRDRLMTAGWAGVLENGFVVCRVDPNELEDCGVEVVVGGA